MKKLATLNVIAWSVFWVFGALAVTEDPGNAMRMSLYALTAFAGLALGIRSYLKICRSGDSRAGSTTLTPNEV
ncbi:hypothetical protein NBRC116586_09870 [Pseudooceanicola nitratireducens]|uniref:hypothetical protein n=1 Tax=Pseudooceanicola nitratireducens TaxID=517719 RepID=UPI00310A0E9C